jgi:hypothetical protein
MMKNGSMQSEYFEYVQSQTEVDDLLEAILGADTTYPWNPTDPQTEAYLEALEQEFSLTDWEPSDIQARSRAFFAQVDQLWLQKSLAQQFAERMPEQLLNQIVERAKKLIRSPLSMAEQLVECVQEVLPAWNIEDLQVLARPLAYAMRDFETESTTVVDSTLKTVRPVSWAELSELEQARLSLSIARYALAQVHQTTDEPGSIE